MMSIRWVVLLVVSSFLVGACGESAGPEDRAEPQADRWHDTTLRGEALSFGPFAVAAEVSFPDRRTLVDARYDLADWAGQEVFVVREGRREDPMDLPAPVDADTKLMIAAFYGPDCEDPGAAPPALLVRTTGRGGESRVDGFRSDLSEAFESAIDDYCSRGIVGRVTGSEQSPDGSFNVYVEVFNPGPSAVELTSPDHEVSGTHWFPVSATIGPAQSREVQIEGEGNGCTAETPWSSGLLTADGDEVHFAVGNDEQC